METFAKDSILVKHQVNLTEVGLLNQFYIS